MSSTLSSSRLPFSESAPRVYRVGRAFVNWAWKKRDCTFDVSIAFVAPDKAGGGGRKHYWRYIDLIEHPQGGQIEDNRYILTSLIQCHLDMERVVPVEGSVDIFALQEKVIASILHSAHEQAAVVEAPKILDPPASSQRHASWLRP